MSAARFSIIWVSNACNLCDASVRFIIDRDPDGRFAFAPLQSRVGRELLAEHGYEATVDPDTFILIENGTSTNDPPRRCGSRDTSAVRADWRIR